MKEAHLVDLAQFSKACDIAGEPSFAWWILYTLPKQGVILSKVKACIHKTTHKYGIKMPANIDHANKLNRENNNTLWRDALAKEMTDIGIDFELLVEGHPGLPAWSKVTGHLV